MKIQSIEEIPVFLRGREKITNTEEFCDKLVGYSISNIAKDIKFIVISEKDRKFFNEYINFYMDESRIDPYNYRVKYEDKYGIAKGTINEIFKIKLSDDSIINVLIRYYSDGILEFEVL